jgi:hypothetical protein
MTIDATRPAPRQPQKTYADATLGRHSAIDTIHKNTEITEDRERPSLDLTGQTFQFTQNPPFALNINFKRLRNTLEDSIHAPSETTDASTERRAKRPSIDPPKMLAQSINQQTSELIRTLKKVDRTKIREYIDEEKVMAVAGYLMSMTRQETLQPPTKASFAQEEMLQGLLHQATSLVSLIDQKMLPNNRTDYPPPHPPSTALSIGKPKPKAKTTETPVQFHAPQNVKIIRSNNPVPIRPLKQSKTVENSRPTRSPSAPPESIKNRDRRLIIEIDPKKRGHEKPSRPFIVQQINSNLENAGCPVKVLMIDYSNSNNPIVVVEEGCKAEEIEEYEVPIIKVLFPSLQPEDIQSSHIDLIHYRVKLKGVITHNQSGDLTNPSMVWISLRTNNSQFKETLLVCPPIWLGSDDKIIHMSKC